MSEAQLQLKELVKIQSITGDFNENKKILDILEQQLKSFGMHTYRTSHNGVEAFVATSQPTKTPKVVLAGHVDVVPAAKHAFDMQVSGDKIIGRGVWDMKSAVVGYVLAAKQLKDSLQDYDFGIMLSTDEEGADLGIKNLLDEGFVPTETAVLFDGAENWQLEKVAKGASGMLVTIKGKTGHGSRPWLVDSSSMRLVALLADIKALFPEEGPLTNTLNISGIKVGEIGVAWNQIPEQSTAMFEFRTTSEAERTRLNIEIDKLCKKHGANQEVFLNAPVLEHDQDDIHYKAFAQSVKKITGIQNKGHVSSGGSSAGYFAKVGVNCIVTWPTGGGHHSDSEWINTQALEDISPVLVDYLKKMARATL